mmetsp:Transcript_26675/g.74913  ORF Transcript_26675/g.74913 Transcript_26675/m.74913 type:complete len:262 (+) Transcript_26675:191-976(+)
MSASFRGCKPLGARHSGCVRRGPPLRSAPSRKTLEVPSARVIARSLAYTSCMDENDSIMVRQIEFYLRTATAADKAAVSSLFADTYRAGCASHYGEAMLRMALPVLSTARDDLLSSGRFYVAVLKSAGGGDGDSEVVIGAGGWSLSAPKPQHIEAQEAARTPQQQQPPGVGHVRHLATHPDFSGRGVAKALIRTSMEAAMAAGVTSMECCATLNAVGFYKAMGFKPVEQKDIFIGDGIPFLIMAMQCGSVSEAVKALGGGK